MNDKFYEQKKEKQDMMINGAMKIFALKGYAHASVDDMVKECGASKGLWFHYFESKKGLYSFVVSYAVKYAILEYGIKLEDKGMGLYDLLLEKEKVKVDLMGMYPYLPLLILSILNETDEEALSLMSDARESYIETLENIYVGIDRSEFEEPDDSFLIQKMITSTFADIMRDYYHKPVFLKEEYISECEKYIQMLKKFLGKK